MVYSNSLICFYANAVYSEALESGLLRPDHTTRDNILARLYQLTDATKAKALCDFFVVQDVQKF